ncbi:hypothetical protein RHGRI_008953 [Rhododendron griersonianum]|uniref:cytidine deaminase n=1 Tax=Rhododendron griersonianum TaxID=479676 RepID=A0AAV6L5J2_9ERIC|nr:hypothetical protein RHGRI_008953 [Rhododendron griersonianum]
MNGPRFVIEATEAESMAQQSNLSLLQLLPTLVKSAQDLARPSISNYHVGAVGLASDGRIFTGVNLEFIGAPLHHSVHAEQFLLTNLAVHGAPRLLALAVSAAPCGHCRQFLQELRHAADLQILITSDQDQEKDQKPAKVLEKDGKPTKDGEKDDKPINYKPLISFLPYPFGPFDLLNEQTPLLLEPHNNGLQLQIQALPTSKNPILCNGHLKSHGKDELLEIAALEAANESHAPYSGCPSGVALMDCEGEIYKGFYMESAAYNPSLGPVQAALVAYVAAGGGSGYERIVAGVLVEREGAAVRQEDTARMFLKLISPKCEVRVLHSVLGSNGCKRPCDLVCE